MIDSSTWGYVRTSSLHGLCSAARASRNFCTFLRHFYPNRCKMNWYLLASVCGGKRGASTRCKELRMDAKHLQIQGKDLKIRVSAVQFRPPAPIESISYSPPFLFSFGPCPEKSSCHPFNPVPESQLNQQLTVPPSSPNLSTWAKQSARRWVQFSASVSRKSITYSHWLILPNRKRLNFFATFLLRSPQLLASFRGLA